jgi:hypothetical protein
MPLVEVNGSDDSHRESGFSKNAKDIYFLQPRLNQQSTKVLLLKMLSQPREGQIRGLFTSEPLSY